VIQRRSLVCEQYRFVLWWHPKAACSSLKKWFYLVENNGKSPPSDIHVYYNRHAVKYRCDKYGGFFHFTVVRHPLARLVSHYRQQIRAPAFNLDLSRPRIQQAYSSFREFIGIVCSTPDERLNAHVAPQWPAIEDVEMDAIYRLENISRHCPLLSGAGVPEYGLPEGSLPQVNIDECCADWREEQFRQSDIRPRWQHYYDETLRSLVRFRFSSDFKWYEL